MNHTLGKDIIFVILALVAALAMLGEHPIVSYTFFVLSILFVVYEHRIFDYVKNA